jgi:LysM repeat protein
MNQWKRLIYYLMINILVSACTTLAVLMIWDRTQTPAALPSLEPAVSVVADLSTPVATGLPQVTQALGATPTATVPGPATQSIDTSSVMEYQIEDGDTLGLIAEQFDVSVNELMAINQISNPDSLPVGMLLYIPVTPTVGPSPTTAPTQTPVPQGSTTPASTPQEARLIINAVIGTGDLASEHVFITRSGDGELSLAGWQLKDEDGNVYTFPQLQLYKDGAVNVWTTSGVNTVVDLYWGVGSAVWSSGEQVTLLDSEGKVRATYTVP